MVPLLILFLRIAEASLESLRTIYISKGHANLAAYVGIVKTGIWLISTGLVLTDLTEFWNLFAYLPVMVSGRCSACRSRISYPSGM